MKSASRTKLAKAFVELLDKHPRAQLVKALAAVMSEQNLTGQTDLLMRDIKRELFRQRGHVEVELTSAHKLTDAELNQLRSFFKTQTRASTVSFESSLDKTLVGGLTASTPGRELDLSIRTKLRRLQAA